MHVRTHASAKEVPFAVAVGKEDDGPMYGPFDSWNAARDWADSHRVSRMHFTRFVPLSSPDQEGLTSPSEWREPVRRATRSPVRARAMA